MPPLPSCHSQAATGWSIYRALTHKLHPAIGLDEAQRFKMRQAGAKPGTPDNRIHPCFTAIRPNHAILGKADKGSHRTQHVALARLAHGPHHLNLTAH
ncbi:hypothetical protein [Asticcacaulis benevestitus]|uniref:Uncharacterized protein n=1 Tax=Asticcacaulis benevestitus DSM 16100 = ATCC BAA-896 TaxID=1121022 RepID=V4P2Z2_9CAUL|nr:hypothetical protein [Asticcacaulis benevestitus]ESQ82486.1 hypothetical protein ABENE_20950 [Asticcacaulis benevestitus DSM 16100 = ATCC BAA-896]